METFQTRVRSLRKLPHKGLVITVILLVLARILILPFSPPGFFLDEAATGAHVVSMLQHGTNANHEIWPLFSASLGGGYTTPIYLYPLVAWAYIFGPSEVSLRYFSQFVTLLAIVAMALAVRLWINNRAALVSAMVALALPWGWLQGSLAWDPVMVPLLVGVSFLAFSTLLFSYSTRSKQISLVALPVSLVAMAYVYPPCRVTAPLLFLTYYIVLYMKKKLSLATIIFSSLSALVIALPLANFMLQPEAIARSSELSVFHDASLFEGIGRLFVNLLLLINPLFLFMTGDPNLRHATGIQGMLGIASIPAAVVLFVALVSWLKKGPSLHDVAQTKYQLLTTLAVLGVGLSLLGSALTNEGQPHSLRSCAAWLFVVILLTLGWEMVVKKRRLVQRIAAGVFIVGTLVYALDLAFYYPSRSSEAFDTSIRTSIYNGQTPADYPQMSKLYYELK
jgi:4-amino-4-deoxy-L-arabinose transferase-like glycosyltransferase